MPSTRPQKATARLLPARIPADSHALGGQATEERTWSSSVELIEGLLHVRDATHTGNGDCIQPQMSCLDAFMMPLPDSSLNPASVGTGSNSVLATNDENPAGSIITLLRDLVRPDTRSRTRHGL